MIHITSLDDGLETFKALGSDTRIQILNILLENEQMSMNQLGDRVEYQQRCSHRSHQEAGRVRSDQHLQRICRTRQSENVFRDAGPHHCGHQETD